MSLRSCEMLIGIFVLFSAVCTGGNMAVAQQSTLQGGPQTVPREAIISFLSLKIFEAATGDLSSCAGDEACIKYAKRIKSLFCAANICGGTDKSREPIACFDGHFDDYSIVKKEQASVAICSWIKSPNVETGRAILALLPDTEADELLKKEAFILALKGSALSCEDTIKNKVGAYGSQWSYKGYRDLSGCRILARERTLGQEEKDFYTWFGVVRGLGNCSDIINSEMRNACNAPGATSPIPAQYGG